jgi:hypothetical protein
MFRSKEHEKVAERAKRVSYDICTEEMCEKGDKIDYPHIYFNSNLPRPMYNHEQDIIEINPNFNHGIDALIHFGGEMPHYFHRHLSNGAYPTDHDEKELLKDKEARTKLRWEEGVAYRIAEIILQEYIKNPIHFAINSKFILPRLSAKECVDKTLKERGTLFKESNSLAKYYGKTGIGGKIVFAALEERYREDSHVGWKVVREIPKNVFKKLLKEGEAHKKISGIQIKSLSQRIAERFGLK